LRRVAIVTASQNAKTTPRRRRDLIRKEGSMEKMRRYMSRIDILIEVTIAKYSIEDIKESLR
jgi:hypothetical protein